MNAGAPLVPSSLLDDLNRPLEDRVDISEMIRCLPASIKNGINEEYYLLCRKEIGQTPNGFDGCDQVGKRFVTYSGFG
jgi:hypothetical protein